MQKISIITPNYNYSKYIGETIESVIGQEYDNFEHIIIDDGSKDNSVAVIQKYVVKYPKKIILVQQENRGQTAAINVGLKMAKGDVIAWINSDDTFCEGTFRKVMKTFNSKPEASIVFGDMNAMDLEGNFIYRRRHLDFSYITGCFLGFTSILSSNAIFWKREVMIKKGLLNDALLCNMDGEYYSRLTQGENVLRIKSALANFRKQHHTKAAEKNPNWDELVKYEVSFELINSYQRLKISQFISYKNSFPIKHLLRLIRVIKRTFKLHFSKKYLEMKRYSKTVKRNFE